MSAELIWVRHPELSATKLVNPRKLRTLANSGWVRLSDDEVAELRAAEQAERDRRRAERRESQNPPAPEPVKPAPKPRRQPAADPTPDEENA